jgi:hypothetical protein
MNRATFGVHASTLASPLSASRFPPLASGSRSWSAERIEPLHAGGRIAVFDLRHARALRRVSVLTDLRCRQAVWRSGLILSAQLAIGG